MHLHAELACNKLPFADSLLAVPACTLGYTEYYNALVVLVGPQAASLSR